MLRSSSIARSLPACLLALVVYLALAAPGHAQTRGTRSDEPTAYSEMPAPAQAEEKSTGMKVLSAICWYIPNRVADLFDIPSLHLSAGDGMGITLRMTKWVFYASHFEDDAYCLGWAGAKRIPPFFGESIQERYFSFLAAQTGEMDRDPTEIGISAHFIVVGINAALSLGEAIDALTGIVGVDLSGDDHGPVWNDYVTPEQAAAAPAAGEPSVTTLAPPPPASEAPAAEAPVEESAPAGQ